MAARRSRPADVDPLDQRTLDRFRGRMSAIEAHVPDPPPLPGIPDADRRTNRSSLSTPRLDRRDARQRNVYALLVVALALLAGVLLPYLDRDRPATGVGPAASPSGSALAGPAVTAVPSSGVSPPSSVTPPTVAPSPRIAPIACPRGPMLFEATFPITESWAGSDWAVVEGRLKAEATRLAILGTRGPFAGPVRPIIWPSGYVEQPTDNGLILTDGRGQTVAREGDLVMLGGQLTDGHAWTACGIRVLKVARSR